LKRQLRLDDIITQKLKTCNTEIKYAELHRWICKSCARLQYVITRVIL